MLFLLNILNHKIKLTFFPLENFLVLKFDDPFEHSPISEQTLILPWKQGLKDPYRCEQLGRYDLP